MKNVATYLIILSFTFYSCDDFLNQEPGTQISINEQLSNKTGVLLAFRGVYVDIEKLLASSERAIYADVQGGNITFTPNNNKLISVPDAIEQSYIFSDGEMTFRI